MKKKKCIVVGMIKIIAVGFGSLVYIWASGDKGGRFGALYHSLLPANPIILHYPDRPLWNFLNFGFCCKGGVGGCLSEQWMVLWAVSVVVEPPLAGAAGGCCDDDDGACRRWWATGRPDGEY